jgi:hypothetical protein
VGDELANGRLRLSAPVNMRKLRVFYMEGIQSPLCQPLHGEMLASLHKVENKF